ncbi:MAG: hypothetical protein K1X82_10215 [Bacteroidia bacterium]|nr:hypothetical protein [Bacteroidia bacterium]
MLGRECTNNGHSRRKIRRIFSNTDYQVAFVFYPSHDFEHYSNCARLSGKISAKGMDIKPYLQLLLIIKQSNRIETINGNGQA